MIHRRLLLAAPLFALFPLGTAAQDAPTAADLAAYVGTGRPFVVFADSDEDPKFLQQMRWIELDPEPLQDREIVVLTDTDPAANGPLRQRLRPHGFGVVLTDIYGQVVLRRPVPTTVREITRAVDRERPPGR